MKMKVINETDCDNGNEYDIENGTCGDNGHDNFIDNGNYGEEYTSATTTTTKRFFLGVRNYNENENDKTC